MKYLMISLILVLISSTGTFCISFFKLSVIVSQDVSILYIGFYVATQEIYFVNILAGKLFQVGLKFIAVNFCL